MSYYRKFIDRRDILKKIFIYVPNDIISLIYEYAETENDICKRLFWNSLLLYEKSSLKHYKVCRLWNEEKYYNVPVKNLKIVAYSREEACLIWMDYLDNNLVKSGKKHKKKRKRGLGQIHNRYSEEFEFMFNNFAKKYDKETYDSYDNTVAYAFKKFSKTGIPKNMLDKFYQRKFSDHRLWIEEIKKLQIILTNPY